MDLGLRIKQLRKEENIKQEHLASKIGITQKELSRIETGNRKQYDLDLLIKISQELNVHLDWLIAGKGMKNIMSAAEINALMKETDAKLESMEQKELIVELQRKEGELQNFKEKLKLLLEGKI